MRSEQVRAISDKMLALIERLNAIEQGKQKLTIGTEEFVKLAEEADQLSRVVKAWAEHQLEVAYQLREQRQNGEGEDVRLVDVEPRQLDRILADWREAEIRLSTTEQGTPAAVEAEADVARLRDEYRAAQDQKRVG